MTTPSPAPVLLFLLGVLTQQPEHLASLRDRYLAGDDLNLGAALVEITTNLTREHDGLTVRGIHGALALDEAEQVITAAGERQQP